MERRFFFVPILKKWSDLRGSLLTVILVSILEHDYQLNLNRIDTLNERAEVLESKQ
ncbi:MAG: hypothetical protein OXC92_03165 [Flavobacteriaceae bacterium]|nr:hypothetical protein [Flavobacteriaceae bacterium]